MDDVIEPLADAIYADKVRRARMLSIGERIDLSFELFEGSLGLMRDGIRAQQGITDPDKVEAVLRQRLKRLRQVADHGIYRPISSQDEK